MEKIRLADVSQKLGISRQSLSKKLKDEDITPIREGRLSYITVEQFEQLQQKNISTQMNATATKIIPKKPRVRRKKKIDPSVEKLVASLEKQIEYLKEQLTIEENTTADVAVVEIDLLHEQIEFLKIQLSDARERELALREHNQALAETNIRFSENYNQLNQVLILTQKTIADLRARMHVVEDATEATFHAIEDKSTPKAVESPDKSKLPAKKTFGKVFESFPFLGNRKSQGEASDSKENAKKVPQKKTTQRKRRYPSGRNS